MVLLLYGCPPSETEGCVQILIATDLTSMNCLFSKPICISGLYNILCQDLISCFVLQLLNRTFPLVW